MKSVLILDDDLGFVFWLGDILNAAGYIPLPAKSVPDARALLDQVPGPVDLLIANPALPEIAGFLGALRQDDTPIKVIAVANAGDTRLGPVDGYCNKPAVPDEEARSQWLRMVGNILASRPAPQ